MNKTFIGIIVAIVIVFIALLSIGMIHTGSFAMQGTTFGPGTYVVGTDIPEGIYDLEGDYDFQGDAIYQASSQGGLSFSEKDVQLKSGSTITIYDGGNMTYKGQE